MSVDLSALDGIALAEDAPVFAEPWEAQAFAMVVHLHERRAFTWEDWAATLSTQIHGGEDLPYYRHWLKALETIVAAKDLTSEKALHQRKAEWLAAAARTPHGEAITL